MMATKTARTKAMVDGDGDGDQRRRPELSGAGKRANDNGKLQTIRQIFLQDALEPLRAGTAWGLSAINIITNLNVC